MPKNARTKTKYPGVFYIESFVASDKPERIYYIMYRRNGRLIEEKIGKQSEGMTPAQANTVRAARKSGKEKSNVEQRSAVEDAKRAEASKWTLDRLWDEYKAQKQVNKGLRTDENRYENHLKKPFGHLEPEQIVELNVTRLRHALLKTRKPQTVKHVLALLKRIVRFGVRNRLCTGLPFEVELPKVDNEKTEDLTPKQLTRLLKAIEADPNTQAKNIMKLAMFTGMRRGELFKLRWEDIDFHRGFITIRGPKGGKDQKIPLNNEARRTLENHPKAKNGFVFPGREGRQRVDINHAISRIKKNAKLPKDFRPLHGLRHFFATCIANSDNDVDLMALQKLLTHKDLRMTLRYAHLRDKTLRNGSETAVKEISQMIEQAQASMAVSERA